MNVTFHAVGSLATAALLSLKADEDGFSSSAFKKLVAGFCAGILVHGIMDFLPHNYPLPSNLDVVFALIVLILFLAVAQKRNWILMSACFAGAIFPDIVDLSAGIANKHLGIPIRPLPFKVFPWHWKELSGSIYDRSRDLESTVCHASVLLLCFILIYVNRREFLRL